MQIFRRLLNAGNKRITVSALEAGRIHRTKRKEIRDSTYDCESDWEEMKITRRLSAISILNTSSDAGDSGANGAAQPISVFMSDFSYLGAANPHTRAVKSIRRKLARVITCVINKGVLSVNEWRIQPTGSVTARKGR